MATYFENKKIENFENDLEKLKFCKYLGKLLLKNKNPVLLTHFLFKNTLGEIIKMQNHPLTYLDARVLFLEDYLRFENFIIETVLPCLHGNKYDVKKKKNKFGRAITNIYKKHNNHPLVQCLVKNKITESVLKKQKNIRNQLVHSSLETFVDEKTTQILCSFEIRKITDFIQKEWINYTIKWARDFRKKNTASRKINRCRN